MISGLGWGQKQILAADLLSGTNLTNLNIIHSVNNLSKQIN